MVSQGLESKVVKLVIEEDRMGSDHKPVLITLRLGHRADMSPTTRDVWDVSKIPNPDVDRSWVQACQTGLEGTGSDLRRMVELLEEIGTESECIADVIENVFHSRISKLALEHIGTKRVGVRKEQKLSSLERLVDQRRKMAEWALTRITGDPESTDQARVEAVRAYRSAKRAWAVIQESKRREKEWQNCRKLEKAGPEKFWQEVKRLRRPLTHSGSPSMIIQGRDGKVRTEPMEALEMFKMFCENIAEADPIGEMGMFDSEFKEQMEEKLENLDRQTHYQEELDKPFTTKEVFRAIRALNMWTAEGMGVV